MLGYVSILFCYILLCCVMLRHDALVCVMLCYVVMLRLCGVLLCFAML